VVECEREKPKCLERNLYQYHFICQNPTWMFLGLKLGLHFYLPELCYGTDKIINGHVCHKHMNLPGGSSLFIGVLLNNIHFHLPMLICNRPICCILS
jgi:hypothetical protein